MPTIRGGSFSNASSKSNRLTDDVKNLLADIETDHHDDPVPKSFFGFIAASPVDRG
jgi:hypothetical protein